MTEKLSKEALAAAETAVEGEEKESLTDLMPPGALRIGNLPARALSMADFRILHRIFAGITQEGIKVDDTGVAVMIIYCLTQVEPQDIAQLWRDASDAVALWEQANIVWAAGFGSADMTKMIEDSTPMLSEFRDAMAVVESAGGEPGEPEAATG